MEQDISVSQTLSAPGQVKVNCSGASTVAVRLGNSGTPSGFHYTIQGSADGTNFFSVPAFDPTTLATMYHGSQTATSGQWMVPCGGLQEVQFNLTAIGGGSAVISMNAGAGHAVSIVAGGDVRLLGELFVQTIPGAAGGTSVESWIVPNNTTAVVVKNDPGQIYSISTFNNGSTDAYLKLYNATSATAGSGTPFDRIGIPVGHSQTLFENGVAYSVGISAIVTTGIADADTTAPAATTFLVSVYYE